jgi:hypothetical protein
MEGLIIKARILPRRISDAAVAGVIGLVQGLALFVVPAFVVGVLTQSPGVGWLTFLAIYVLWLLFTVRHLRCDEEALEFVRTLGTPKRIPWAHLESVEEAPRAELVLRGWLWPPFPAREMTPSLTSLGHYRIRWRGGEAYFPPKDVQQFLDAIQKGRERAGTGLAPSYRG